MKSIADVVSAAGLYQYAEVALLLFFGVFVAVLLRVLTSNKDSLDRAARMPLDDEARPAAPAHGGMNVDR